MVVVMGKLYTYTPRIEEVLSYLCGMAPVGEMFALNRRLVAKELGIDHTYISYALSVLLQHGAVKKEELDLLRVVKRPEQLFEEVVSSRSGRAIKLFTNKYLPCSHGTERDAVSV